MKNVTKFNIFLNWQAVFQDCTNFFNNVVSSKFARAIFGRFYLNSFITFLSLSQNYSFLFYSLLAEETTVLVIETIKQDYLAFFSKRIKLYILWLVNIWDCLCVWFVPKDCYYFTVYKKLIIYFQFWNIHSKTCLFQTLFNIPQPWPPNCNVTHLIRFWV